MEESDESHILDELDVSDEPRLRCRLRGILQVMQYSNDKDGGKFFQEKKRWFKNFLHCARDLNWYQDEVAVVKRQGLELVSKMRGYSEQITFGANWVDS